MQKKTTSELVAEKPGLKEFHTQKRHPLYVMLHNVRSLQNVGIVFRLSDALRVEKLFITGYTGYPMVEGIVPGIGKPDERENRVKYHAQREIEKTAIQTVSLMPWEQYADPLPIIKSLKQNGVHILAVEQTHESVSYIAADFHFPVCLIFGHEREGVGDELLALADQAIEIPMYGYGNSLNVATSLAVIGYQYIQRLASIPGGLGS